MKTPNKTDSGSALFWRAEQELQQRADALANQDKGIAPEGQIDLSLDAMQATLHNLQVHQIELELQNEELRRTQLELTAARTRYFDLYDLAPLGYCTVSEKGFILEANFAAGVLLDIPRKSLVGQRLSRFIHKTHQDTYYLFRQGLLDSGVRQSCELEMLKPDGTLVWVQMALGVEMTVDNEPELRLIMTDISLHKQMMAEIKRNALLYDVAFNLAPTGMVYLDLKGRFISVNANLCKISGFSSTELLQMKVTDLTHPDDYATDKVLLDQYFGGDIPTYETEKRYVRKDGSACWVSVAARMVQDVDGHLLYSVGVVADITKRKAAEALLVDSQARLRHAADAARLTYVEVDLARGGTVIAANFEDVMGFLPPQEQAAHVGAGIQALLDHLVPADRPQVEAALDQLVGGMPGGKIEYRVLGDDGAERFIESTWSVLRDAGNRPIKSFATSLDISERKRVDQALRDSEARYRNLFESMDEGYATLEVIFDALGKPVDYRFLETNPSFESLTGLKNAIGKRMREMFPDIEDFWIELYGDVALTGKARRVASEAKSMNRWFNVYASRMGGAGSTLVTVLFTNITEQQNAAEALRQSEEKYRTLFESIDEGFCVLKLLFDDQQVAIDFEYEEVNPTFQKQTGLNNVLGKRVSEVIPTLESHWLQILGKVALTGQAARYINQAAGLDGRWFEAYACRVGEPADHRVAVIFTDITDRKNAEARQAEFDRLLIGKNVELERAIQVAETANQAKSDFLSGMSHELRTPLSAILGFAQLIESSQPPPTATQKRSVIQILQAGWYLLELINEILDLALVESGKLALELQPVLLSNAMDESRSMIEQQAHQRGVAVTFPEFTTPVRIQADGKRLKQILINLLSNAIKYNRVNGWVTVTCEETTNGRVRIGVRDGGQGLAPKKLAHLFEPFNRLGQEALTQQGTGIGLVMTKRLVELMGGTIGVESQDGQGCLFWFELNCPTAEEASGIPQEKSVTTAAVHTLLYVDPDLAHLEWMNDLTERHPEFRLLAADNGADAIEIARTERPDVMLLELNLPGISGIEVQEILASDAATSSIPIVALTNYVLDHHIDESGQARFFCYLSKPIQMDQLLQSLDAALAHAAASTLNQPISQHDHH